MIEDAGGSVVIADAQADVQKHNENIENLINSGIDGLIVHLGDPEQMAPLMEEAEKKGIPVITNGVGSPVAHTIGDVNGDDPLMANPGIRRAACKHRDMQETYTLCGFRERRF